MYHCTTHCYLFRIEKSIQKIITSMDAGNKFDFLFATGEILDGNEIEKADVIFANIQGLDVGKTMNILASKKKKESELIILASQEEIGTLLETDLQIVTDIWKFPMSDEECLFYLKRWKQSYVMEKDYWEARHFLDTTINSVPALIWFKDKEGAHEKVNDSFCQAVGKTKEQIQGRGHYYIWDIEPEEYAKGEFICMESEFEVMEKRHTCVFAEKVKVGDEIRQFETYKSPLFDFDGSVMGTVGVANDVTQERLYQQMIIDNANTDFLTGLYNRRYLYEFIEMQGTKALAVYYLDLDNFKSVNDQYGHQEGDRALILTKDILKECMPGTVIARIGGDEFLIVQEGALSEEEIEQNRKRLQNMLGDAYKTQEAFRMVSASIGTAYSKEGETAVLDTLIERADALMYQEKRAKKKMKSSIERE